MLGRFGYLGESFSPVEIAAGVPFGLCPDGPPAGVERSPRLALENLVREALTQHPCLIAFSGGRDSSALLAVAVDVARREGLSLPVPVTLRFRSAGTREGDWQELVLRHFGLNDWVRREFDDELDLVGPIATPGLRRHGLLYPANVHLVVPMARAAAGGSLLTGVGGDDVFGNWPWHGIASLFAGRRRARLADLRRLIHLATPPGLRAQVIVRREPLRLPWIVPSARGRVAEMLATEEASAPRTWEARALWSARRRPWRCTAHSMELLARDAGASLGSPFLDPGYLASLGAAGARFGWGDRDATMRALFGDLLPPEVITRRSKAEFSGPLFGRYTKQFAADWNGRMGTAAELLDGEVLRNVWRAERPHFLSAMALQAAWIEAAPTSPLAQGDAAVRSQAQV